MTKIGLFEPEPFSTLFQVPTPSLAVPGGVVKEVDKKGSSLSCKNRQVRFLGSDYDTLE